MTHDGLRANGFIVVRLAWVHAQATRDRWWEEVRLLKEELRRVGETFTYRSSEWESIGQAAHEALENETHVTRGAKAYAYRQAAVYRLLASDAKRRYEDITGPYKPKLFGEDTENEGGEGQMEVE